MSNLTNIDLHRQASYQIEAMCLSMRDAAQSKDAGLLDALPYLVLSIAQRIIELNSAWVNSLGDTNGDEGTLDTLQQALFGSRGVQYHE